MGLRHLPPVPTSQQIAHWTVLHEFKAKGRIWWQCRCSCGREQRVWPWNLLQGKSLRCNHCSTIGTNNPNWKHGHGKKFHESPEYHAWLHMKQRCLNPSNKAAHNYIHRGIRIAPEWAESFQVFYDHIGPKPEGSRYSIDRIDNNGHYEPGNVRWATPKEQMRNVRYQRIITIDGMSKSLAEWCEMTGLKYGTVYTRIKRYGWSEREALQFDPFVRSRTKSIKTTGTAGSLTITS